MSDQIRTWTIVKRAHADASSGRLSVESPIVQAIIGKDIGDEVAVIAPRGARRYVIENANPIVN